MTNWPKVKFGDVVRHVKDKVDPQTSGLERYIAGEHMDTDDLHLRRWGEIGEDYLGPAFHMRFKPGQVLYGSRRTYLRKVAVADFEGITANTTYVLEPKDPDVLLPELLPFIMSTETFHEHSIQQSKGSVNPYINFSDIEWYEFPLPPIDEQRRIADLLWAADDVNNNYIDVSLKFENLRRSIIDRLLLPEADGKFAKLKDVTSRVTVGIATSAVHAYSSTGGIPLIRNTDIQEGYITREDMPTITSAFDEKYSTKRVNIGDVVTARTGKPGISAVVPGDLQNAQTFTTLITTPKKDVLDSDFLCWWLNSSHGQSYVLTRKAGAIQQNLNATLLKEMPIWLPTLDKQKTIIEGIREILSSQQKLSNRKTNAISIFSKIREQLLSH